MSDDTPKRLTAREWAEAGALWQTGDFTLDDLSAKYEVAKETLSRKFTKLGLKKGATAQMHAKEAAKKVQKESNSDAALIAKRIRDTKEQHYEWAAGLSRMAMSEVARSAQANGGPAMAMPNLKAIEKAMAVVQRGRTERYAVLGLDREDHVDDDDLPDLLIAEMTAEDVIDEQQRQMDASLGLDGEADDDESIIIEAEETEGGSDE